MIVTYPPATKSHADLLNFRRLLRDAIILAVDFEATPFFGFGPGARFSVATEMGIASLDMREIRKDISKVTPEDIAQKIEARHYLVRPYDYWDTRERESHRPKRNYKARLNSMFCRSEVVNSDEEMMEKAKHVIEALRAGKPSKAVSRAPPKPPSHGYTITKEVKKEEKKTAGNSSVGQLVDQVVPSGVSEPKTTRDVVVLFWDSKLEESILDVSRHNPFNEEGEFVLWDLQRWLPIQQRYGREQCRCSQFVEGVGLEDMTDFLHNAANDSWAVLMGFMQVLRLGKDDFEAFIEGGEWAKSLEFTWLDPNIQWDNRQIDGVV